PVRCTAIPAVDEIRRARAGGAGSASAGMKRARLPMRALTAHDLKAMLADAHELALIDLREELIFAERHLLWARSVPLSRLELNFPRLVPRLSTRIVLCDDADGLAERAAAVLARAGYADLSCLDGGGA